MTIIRKKRSSEMVTRRASARATELIVLEISHRINSASTAAKAIVEEKVNADNRLTVGRVWSEAPEEEENGRV